MRLNPLLRKTGRFAAIRACRDRWNQLTQSRVVTWLARHQPFLFLRQVLRDYGEVAKDSLQYSRDRPFRTAAMVTGVCCGCVLNRRRPGETEYWNELRHYSMEMMLLSADTRNPVSDSYLAHLHKLRNHGLVRFMNCGLFTIAWRGDFDPSVKQYSAQVSRLKPGLREFSDRIIDVGFLGRWLMLFTYMRDFDINDGSFQNTVYNVNLQQAT